ncbi:MAG TPA: S8 family serine peptidase [Gaiellaceae bacterium]|nr:S8 family serine peptidase [Gaiellaceae bacterium]
MPTLRARPFVLLLVSIVATTAAVTSIKGDVRPLPAQGAASWAGLTGLRPPVALPNRSIVVLRTPSLAAHVHAAGGHASRAQERAWVTAATAAQNALLGRLSGQGIDLHPELRFTRVLDGFSATFDPVTAARLEQDPDVAGVYPVRVAYPAETAAQLLAGPLFGPESGHTLPAPPLGLTGSGVTIALLDTYVDARARFLHRAVLPEIDVVGPTRGYLAVEHHGTEMAGLIVGQGGPGGLHGVAPGAKILPIRVAARQRDTRGTWAVFARSDQIIAGLERAVDPNGDGDAHDAVPLAVLPLAEPYAGFADSPEATAASGALALGTLVVGAAGNDGPAAARFGDLSGPGAASAALTVGAADLRPTVSHVPVSLQVGKTTYRGVVAVSGIVAPQQRLSLRVAQPRASGSTLGGFFDSAGTSLVAGRAALVMAGTSPLPFVRRAGTAGAAAVVVSSPTPLAAGGVPLENETAIPVVSIPRSLGQAAQRELSAGGTVRLTIDAATDEPNPDYRLPAAFSSTGLSFAGELEPDVVSPGVALATADPPSAQGAARWITVSGTSAAAATAAGTAALLLQHDPTLRGAALAGLLTGYAQQLNASLTAQGAGLLNPAAALDARIVAAPATLVVRDGEAVFVLTNLTDSATQVALGNSISEGSSGLSVTFEPSTLTLPPHGSARVTAKVVALPPARGSTIEGIFVATPTTGGSQLRIPWALRFPARPVSLLGRVFLSQTTFSPGDATPAALSVDAGRLFGASARPDVRALSRLDVELWRGGTDLGVLARLRDVLPGRYTFGLTGRGPDGAVLSPGNYAVVVVATPVDGGNPTRRKVRFELR